MRLLQAHFVFDAIIVETLKSLRLTILFKCLLLIYTARSHSPSLHPKLLPSPGPLGAFKATQEANGIVFVFSQERQFLCACCHSRISLSGVFQRLRFEVYLTLQ